MYKDKAIKHFKIIPSFPEFVIWIKGNQPIDAEYWELKMIADINSYAELWLMPINREMFIGDNKIIEGFYIDPFVSKNVTNGKFILDFRIEYLFKDIVNKVNLKPTENFFKFL
ncbi:MAG: hypothetical protein K9G64_09035 [Bacteroidia bacterium]|nr:hypothetical protein [Bacteroidia bacterium]